MRCWRESLHSVKWLVTAVAWLGRVVSSAPELPRDSVKLEEAGHLNERGQAFNAQSVRAMVAGPQSRAPRITAAKQYSVLHRTNVLGTAWDYLSSGKRRELPLRIP